MRVSVNKNAIERSQCAHFTVNRGIGLSAGALDFLKNVINHKCYPKISFVCFALFWFRDACETCCFESLEILLCHRMICARGDIRLPLSVVNDLKG